MYVWMTKKKKITETRKTFSKTVNDFC